MVALLGLLISAAALAATPPGTAIDNRAIAYFDTDAGTAVQVESNTVTIISAFGRTPASAQFQRLAANPGAPATALGPVQCNLNGVFTALPAPPGLDGQPLDLNAAQPVTATALYNTDETAFVRLDDGDQNLEPLVRERVEVRVSNPLSGDAETLLLLENAPNSGVFTGYLPLADSAPQAGDCTLQGPVDSSLQVTYTDPADAADTTAAAALIEPLSIVFDAATGLPVDNATITLIDEATGLPATVFGNDGVSAYPATVVSGAAATDASGVVYNVPAGGYRFPVVPAGRYRLQIVPPPQYLAPSSRSEAELNALPGAPFDLGAASFGAPFEQLLDGATTLVDVPLDPFDGGLFLTKSTTAASAAVGDFVRYRLTLQNSSERVPATGVRVVDTLPYGFRYVPGSARINDAPVADPTTTNAGLSLDFALPDIAPLAQSTVTYVLEVTGGVRGKQAVNSANATADRNIVSNEAVASIRLREDLFRSRSTLIGRVVEGECRAETFAEDAGVEGVRIYLEDGRYAVTDAGGRFHLEGVDSGRHTVQIDPLTIPDWLELAPCADAPRFGGRTDSQWVNLRPGLVQRADFYLKRKAPANGDVALQLINRGGTSADRVDYELIVRGRGDVALRDVSVTVLLPRPATLIGESARLGGRRIASPRATGNAVVFGLGERTGAWSDTITFSAKIDPLFAGELVTRAVANFNTAAARNQRTPVGEARMMREAATTENADYVLSLNFDVLSAELSASDREALDLLVEAWRGVSNIEISAVGHTDADRIAARNRHIFADNYALSEARARSAVGYLASQLNVAPGNISVVGRGADQPVASNDSVEGKRRNRRVELVMTGLRPGKQSVIEVTQERSDELKVDTVGAIPGPESVADPLDQRIAEINERGAALVKVEEVAEADWPATDQFLLPAPGYQPPIPSLAVSVVHAADARVELSLNDTLVSKLNFDGRADNATGTRAVSRWRGVDLADGDNRLVARIIGADGRVLRELSRLVHYAGQPIRGELVPKQSRLVADGRNKPVIAVRLFDGDDQPARAGSIGGFRIDAPYRSWFEVDQARENKLVAVNQREPFYRIGPDGIAYIELEPTTRAGEVTLRLKFENQREQELRAYLTPEPRDWILVGFAEGTVGYNTLRDSIAAADAAGVEEDLYTQGRVAFFAKGRIRGDYLLTLAYDTRGRDDDRDRFETEVDPDQYFTIYGDGTESRFEAASQRKLFVKLERQQFVALFGDFDTGLSTTDLARYERRFNGVHSQYFGDRFTYTAFAAETDQSFVRDDIPGDGTSGLYRLSASDLVINSERVRIETRDRFNASQVIASRTLTRFLDYDIDYFAGTLFFKQPVPSRDGDLNPLVIVAEYEARRASDDDVVAGGRAAVKFLDDDLEVGATLVREENAIDDNTLVGVDLRYQVNEYTLLRAEYADTDNDDVNGARSGYAYRVELEHRSGELDARVFHELADSGFGVGQQATSQVGVQASGVEARWQLAERWFLQTLAGYQENLDTGTERMLGEAEIRYEDTRNTAALGLTYVDDETADGVNNKSTLARLGVSRNFLSNRLTLRMATEQALSGNDASVDYPARTTAGLDWKLGNATLFAEHEWADGENIEAQTSRLGVRATPWQRAQFTTTLDNEITEFGPRLFANIGLVQGWQVSERWTLDIGIDHSNTLIAADAPVFDDDRELASGSLRSDFVAGFVGALYQSDLWSLNARYEQRNADNEDRQTVVAGWYREPIAGHAFSAGVQLLDSNGLAGKTDTQADVRFGWAYRKAERRWSFLDRLDLVYNDATTPVSSARSIRYVNNFNAVRRIGAGSELALQYAAKYVRSEFDDVAYTGYTDLAGIDFRRAWRPNWDWGIHASVLHSWRADVIDYGFGAEIGFNPRDNLWLTFGYNVAGFYDADFESARYTAEGPYLNITIKADQHTLADIAGRLRGRR